jgi:hypothetical protein
MFRKEHQSGCPLGAGEQMKNDFTVACRLENCALTFESVSQGLCVDQVAVVDQGYGSVSADAFNDDRLRIAFVAVPAVE